MYSTYTLYNPADVRWDILSDIMSSYYLHIYHILGLNGVKNETELVLTEVDHLLDDLCAMHVERDVDQILGN